MVLSSSCMGRSCVSGARGLCSAIHVHITSRIPTAVKVSIGESKGQTVLPLPTADPAAIAAAAAASAAAVAATPAAAGDGPATAAAAPGRPARLPPAEAEKVHILETAIVTWTRQIKKVLQADPDAPLKVCKTRAMTCWLDVFCCWHMCTVLMCVMGGCMCEQRAGLQALAASL